MYDYYPLVFSAPTCIFRSAHASRHFVCFNTNTRATISSTKTGESSTCVWKTQGTFQQCSECVMWYLLLAQVVLQASKALDAKKSFLL